MVADKEVTHVSPRDPFTVIYPGDVRELVSNVFYKPRPGAKTQLDSMYSGPQALPRDVTKCSHYEVEESEVLSTMIHRCQWKVQKGMANGFLCQDHQVKVIHVEKKPVPLVRFGDAALIESILKSEARLISQGHKERVRLTTKGDFITYVS